MVGMVWGAFQCSQQASTIVWIHCPQTTFAQRCLTLRGRKFIFQQGTNDIQGHAWPIRETTNS